jgi:hypothetical protein
MVLGSPQLILILEGSSLTKFFDKFPSRTVKIRIPHNSMADHAYDLQQLYESNMVKGFQLVCPVKRYKKIHQKEERLKRVDFYKNQSALGQVPYFQRDVYMYIHRTLD